MPERAAGIPLRNARYGNASPRPPRIRKRSPRRRHAAARWRPVCVAARRRCCIRCNGAIPSRRHRAHHCRSALPAARTPSAGGGRGAGPLGRALWQRDPADFAHPEAITPAHPRGGRAGARAASRQRWAVLPQGPRISGLTILSPVRPRAAAPDLADDRGVGSGTAASNPDGAPATSAGDRGRRRGIRDRRRSSVGGSWCGADVGKRLRAEADRFQNDALPFQQESLL